MTHPEYLRQQCMVDGERKRLTPMETELVALLLVSPPDRTIEYGTLIEALWPNPDDQPLWAPNILTILKYRLRRKGITIVTVWGRGFTIPEDARGGRPVRQYVPMFTDEALEYLRAA